MAMYNEDDSLFTEAMQGVMKSIAHLCKHDRSKTWGKDGWTKNRSSILSATVVGRSIRELSVLLRPWRVAGGQCD